jgi:MFS family permease
MDFSSASILVIVLNAVGIPARIIPPLFSDRFGPINTLLPVFTSLSLVTFCWLAVKSVAGLYVFTCFYGIFSASLQCLIPTTITSITKRLDMAGTRMGMAFSILSFAALTGPPIGGALQRADGGHYDHAIKWAAASSLVSVVLLVVTRIFRGDKSARV